MSRTFQLTPEQEAIVSAARDTTSNLMVTAFAGCSKTTTLELIAKALPPQASLALAFNVKIKKELEARFPAHFTVLTMNGLGHRAWGAATRKRLEVDDRKMGRITTQVLRTAKLDKDSELWDNVRSLASAAQARGLVPSQFPHATSLCADSGPMWQQIADDAFIDADGEAFSLAREVLVQSILEAMAGKISYDDQIYMPTLFHGQFPRYPLVMVDEAQDLSPMNHRMVAKVAAGRLIVVGDPKQSIYAFRGADTESMSKLRGLRQEWTELPLSVTFRCPRSVVARQQRHVPGFAAFHTNAEGTVLDLSHSQWEFRNSTQKPGTLELAWVPGKDEETTLPVPHNDVAVLCRNTAPLIKLAFRLLRVGIPPMVLGRDIGKSLVTLAKKILPADGDAEALREAIEQWRWVESANAKASENEQKLAGIHDRAESLLAVLAMARVQTKPELLSALEDLFSESRGAITLATIHRAKGLEWSMVFHLDPWRIPSKYAKKAAALGDRSQLGQEYNLLYVCETRAKHTLVMASLSDNEEDGKAEGGEDAGDSE